MIFNIFGDSNLDFSTKLIYVLALLLSAVTAIVFHELAHGFVALKMGDYTAKSRGRLTLDPTKHFDLMGLAMLMLVGFGWAKPVPIDSRNFTNYKKGMVLVSLAGVVTNLIMAAIALLIFYIILPHVGFATATDSSFVVVIKELFFYFFMLSFQINMMLAFFNILPICPLDGYNLVAVFLKPQSKYKQFMLRYGYFLLLGLIIGGMLFRRIGLDFLDIFGLFGDIISSILNLIIKLRLT